MAKNAQITVEVKKEEVPDYPEPDGYMLVSMTNGGVKSGYVKLTFLKRKDEN